MFNWKVLLLGNGIETRLLCNPLDCDIIELTVFCIHLYCYCHCQVEQIMKLHAAIFSKDFFQGFFFRKNLFWNNFLTLKLCHLLRYGSRYFLGIFWLKIVMWACGYWHKFKGYGSMSNVHIEGRRIRFQIVTQGRKKV